MKTKSAMKIPPVPAPAPIQQPDSPPPIETGAPIRVQYVPLSQVEFGPNVRDRRSITPEAVDAMASSILRQGIANPITVMAQKDGQFTLVCGQLRVLGAMRAGLETIPARIVPLLHTEQIRDLQAAENLQREAFGLVEEAELCRSVYEREGGPAEGLDRAVLARVAQRLGRTPKWCNERLRVGRLDPQVLEEITAGKVTHAQALLIAQVADPAYQRKIAETCVKGWWQGSPLPLDEVVHEVNRFRNRLATVAWDTQAVQPGVAAPACRDCPHNTANDADLFAVIPELVGGRGADQPREQIEEGGAWCRKGECFEAKTKWAAKAAEKAAAEVVKQVKADKALAAKSAPKRIEVADTLVATSAVVPAGVSREAVRDRAREALAPKPAKTTPAAGSGSYDYAAANRRWKEQQARRNKLDKAVTAWVGDICQQLSLATADKPLKRMVYRLLEAGSAHGNLQGLRSFRAEDRRKAKLPATAAQWIECLRDPTPDKIERLAVEAFVLEDLVEATFAGQRAWNDSAIAALSSALGLTIPPKPTAASIAKAERAAESAKAPAAKKPAAVVLDKPKLTRVRFIKAPGIKPPAKGGQK
jgi:ParB/RepB/Spo0J family partition protein